MQSLKSAKMALSTAAFSDAPPVSIKLGLGDLIRVVMEKGDASKDKGGIMAGLTKQNTEAIEAVVGGGTEGAAAAHVGPNEATLFGGDDSEADEDPEL